MIKCATADTLIDIRKFAIEKAIEASKHMEDALTPETLIMTARFIEAFLLADGDIS